MAFADLPEWVSDPEYRWYVTRRMLIKKEYDDILDRGGSVVVWPHFLHEHPAFQELAKTNKYAQNEMANAALVLAQRCRGGG